MFPESKSIEAIPGLTYTNEFSAKELKIGTESACCLAKYGYDLLPGQEKELVFLMPRVPVADNALAFIGKMSPSNYNLAKRQIIRYWADLFDNNTTFYLPEKKIKDAQKASLVHLVLATRSIQGNHKTQADGIPYPWFFLTSMPQMVLAYLSNGQPAKLSIMNAIGQQEEDGLYFDRMLAHGIMAHGHVLYAAGSYYLYTRDIETARLISPSLKKLSNILRKQY